MSKSSRTGPENETSKLDLPIFVSPNELIFSPNRKRSLLTIFNPYEKEAQFHIMTTSPERFDLSHTKGILKPNRRIDISIRLFGHQLDDLPIPSEEIETIDYFKIHVQIGTLKGNRQVKVCWSANNPNETFEVDESQNHLISPNDAKSNKHKIKNLKPTLSKSNDPIITTSQRSSTRTTGRASDLTSPSGIYQANLVCTLGSLCCVFVLFLPLSVDMELCKKLQAQDQNRTQISGLVSQLISLFSVNYELKLVCSFALGLFTYRLISTMPE